MIEGSLVNNKFICFESDELGDKDSFAEEELDLFSKFEGDGQ